MRNALTVVVLGALLLGAVVGAAVAGERVELQVDGMACPFCEAAVESVLRAQPGVVDADADFRTGRAVVMYEPDRTNPATLADAVNKRSFYRARPIDPSEESAARKPAR